MKVERIIDKDYKEYIEQLPCHICGHTATGNRKLYSEYKDEYYYLPCKNTAHHVDKDMTRAKNDTKLLPMCGHYVVSGKGTNNCHEKVHSEAQYKTREAIEEFNTKADDYYQKYLESRGI